MAFGVAPVVTDTPLSSPLYLVLLFPFAGFIISGILGALGFIGSTVASAFVTLWPFIVTALSAVWKALSFLGGKVFDFAKAVGGWVKEAFEFVTDKLADLVKLYIDKVQPFLKRVFGPIADIVKKAAELLEWFSDHILTPFMTGFGMVRRVLQVLGELGWKWASLAAERLLAIETRIWQTFQSVANWVNRISYYTNLLLDPLELIKEGLFLKSFFRVINPIWNGLANVAMRRNPDTYDPFIRAKFKLRPGEEATLRAFLRAGQDAPEYTHALAYLQKVAAP